ncbi:uncharacterized protein LOC115896335 isoform X3 [Rhinopithecus roxellana]|uniref:uncharacterized protein LOC115896335 isoform X3 n=1 Tax=Rhinopithecus roxellana TaxID=61622 RepID=UPI001237123F|nr:uncharacterized protein LOC115896335 isoform X3 [Rhinopithecus roxellana]
MLQEYLPMFTKKHVQGFHCSNAELSASQFAQFIKKQCGATGTNHEASPGSLTSYPSHLLDRRCQLITLNVYAIQSPCFNYRLWVQRRTCDFLRFVGRREGHQTKIT